MKKSDIASDLAEIAADSFALLHVDDLTENASVDQIIEALKRDAKWQDEHNDEVQRSIDYLITQLEESQ